MPETRSDARPIGVIVFGAEPLPETPNVGGVHPILRHALALQSAGIDCIAVAGAPTDRVPADPRGLWTLVPWTPDLESVPVLAVRADTTYHRQLLRRAATELPTHGVTRFGSMTTAPHAASIGSGARTIDALLHDASPTDATEPALLPEEFVLPARTADERHAASRSHLRSLRKATGGVFERIYMRPISMHLTRMLMNTRVTPNAMTIVTFAHAVLAAALVCTDSRGLQIAGGLLHIWMRVVDCIDGELARLRYQSSRFGEWLDSVCDGIGLALLVAAATYQAAKADPRLLPVGAVGVAAWMGVQLLQYRAAQLAGGAGNFQQIEWGHRAKTKTPIERFVGKVEMSLRIDAISTYYGLAIAFGWFAPLVVAHTTVAVVAIVYFGAQVLKLAKRRSAEHNANVQEAQEAHP
ncbi:MAG: CDP-alcohol phosphatidyltransferase family protein [Polyangiales bacterium]|nr:CDP-alcohol phosphatidyltransferase family protein [Myxococcales bacterium]